MIRQLLFLLLPLIFITNIFSQDSTITKKRELRKNMVAFSPGLTFIPAGTIENVETTGVMVPTIGFDYLRRLHKNWEIGVMVDFEFGKYSVPKKYDNLKRHNAIVFALVTAFTVPNTNLNFYGGVGVEFEQHKHLGLLRLGAEYQIRLGEKGWFLGPNVFMDYKDHYDTWAAAIAIGKEF